MKPIVIFLVAAGVFGVGMLIQIGVMPRDSGSAAEKSDKQTKQHKPKARFPEDLVPAAQAKPVPAAAGYKPGANGYKIVFLNPRGEMHHWNSSIPEDWQAGTVEETELVVVLPDKQNRIFVNRINYVKAPPIDRFIHEVEIAIVDPKAGGVIENRKFRNLPRQVHNIEAFRRTMLGRTVEWHTVFDYLAQHSKTGFTTLSPATTVDVVVD